MGAHVMDDEEDTIKDVDFLQLLSADVNDVPAHHNFRMSFRSLSLNIPYRFYAGRRRTA